MSHSSIHELEVFGPKIRRSDGCTWIHGALLYAPPLLGRSKNEKNAILVVLFVARFFFHAEVVPVALKARTGIYGQS